MNYSQEENPTSLLIFGEAGVITTADRKIEDKVDMLVMFIVCMIR